MSAPEKKLPSDIDLTKPSIARVYDAMLGGKDNFEVDRGVLQRMIDQNPDTERLARENRTWVRRVVRWLVRDANVAQFIDLGSGLPTVENTHQVAQRHNPDAVVVYVDNDPTVIAHGRALLEDNDNTHFNGGDLTEPDDVFSDPTVVDHIDLDQPVALLQCFTLHHIPDADEVDRLLADYIGRLASGSYLVVSHIRRPDPGDRHFDRFTEAAAMYQKASPGFAPRSTSEVEAMFAGLELVEPGVVAVQEWWPEGPLMDEYQLLPDLAVGGIARKP